MMYAPNTARAYNIMSTFAQQNDLTIAESSSDLYVLSPIFTFYLQKWIIVSPIDSVFLFLNVDATLIV
jgi:hypothetical protein